MAHNLRKRAMRLSPERRRAEIIRCARELIREKGYDEINMADIAHAVGVVEGTLYRYFESKDALLLGVVSEWYERAMEDYDQALGLITGCRDQLRYMVWRHLETIHRDPDLAELVFQKIRALPNYRSTIVYDLNQQYTVRTTGIVHRAMEAGELRRGIPLKVVRDLLFGSVEHHCFAYIRGEGDFCPVTAAEALVDIVYSGLRVGSDGSRADAVLERLEGIAERLEHGLEGAASS